MSDNFLLDSTCFEFYILGAGYSYILKTACELCARIQISYLEILGYFCSLLFKVCEVGQEEPLL